MQTYKQWREGRRLRRSKEQYANGFGWAMAAYYIDLDPIEHIEARIDFTPYAPPIELDSYYSGAGGAIFELRRIEEAKSDLRETLERLAKCEFVLTGELDMAETREEEKDDVSSG